MPKPASSAESTPPRRLYFVALWRSAIRYPRAILSLVILALPLLALQARTVSFQPRIDLLSPEDPISRAERERRAEFGQDFRVLVALFKPFEEGGVLGWPARAALLEMHQKLQALPGVRRVSSLVNASAAVASPGVEAGSSLWTDASDPNGVKLVEKVQASVLQRLLYLSLIANITPIYLEAEPSVSEALLVSEIRTSAKDVERNHRGAGEFLIVGPAVVETSLGAHIFDDLTLLIPFALVVVMLVLLLVVRDWRFVLIATLHSVALLAIVLAGMASLRVPLNLVSVLAPVILVPVGVADLLHLFVRLASGVDARGRSGNRAEVLEAAFGRLEPALIGTTATTVVGFLCFLVSPVQAVRQFGLVMSAGAAAAMFITFTFDAALLAVLWKPKAGEQRAIPRRASIVERWLLGIRGSPEAARYRSRVTLLACAVLAVAGIVAMTRLRVQDTWIGNFDPDSRVARDVGRFEQFFLGSNILAIDVSTNPSIDGSLAAALDVVNKLSYSYVIGKEVSGTLSVTALARSLDPNQGTPWQPWATPTPQELSRFLAQWERLNPPLPRLSMLANPERTRFQVLVFVKNQPYEDLVRFVEKVRARSEEMAGGKVNVTFGGDLVTNIRMVEQAVLAQGYSLAAAFIALIILAVVFTRSALSGAVLVLPLALAILLTYLFLIITGIPYGVAVSMFPTLVIGLAIDFAIHVRTALGRNQRSSRTRWARDLAIVVRGILLNAGLWMAGFGVLIFSHLPPNRYLGILSSVVVALSAAATLLLIPTAMLSLAGPSPVPERAAGQVP